MQLLDFKKGDTVVYLEDGMQGKVMLVTSTDEMSVNVFIDWFDGTSSDHELWDNSVIAKLV